MAFGDHLNWWQGPPVLRNRVRNYVLAAIAFGLAAPLFVLLRKPLNIPMEPWGRFGALVLGLIPITVCWPLFLIGRRRIHRLFADARGRLCTHCAYDLRAMDARGTCPECGQPFDAARDAETWKHAQFTIDA